MSVEMDGTRAPVRMWLDPVETEYAALNQIRTVADLPWVDGVAVMPDAHLGVGSTIGTVIASKTAVCPAAVGVDIGCGMNAVHTSLIARDLPDSLAAIRAAFENVVPVGMASHEEIALRGMATSIETGWSDFIERFDELKVGPLRTKRLDTDGYKHRVMTQLGTLGGGNHFIELCSGEDGSVWLMLHSGSRNVGKEIAERHIEVASKLPVNAGVSDKHLAALMDGSPEMAAYRHDLYWAQEYARRSRSIMMALIKDALSAQFDFPVLFDEEINCHHNYVSEEEYDGERMIITRKGAISTRDRRLGVIPGSMGTGSFIVRGLSNDAAYCSASHGAGRKMSRGAAKRQFTEADLAAQTMGVECRKDAGVIDEIPAAYKSLEEVMAHQRDLVEVVEKLTTLVCVKG